MRTRPLRALLPIALAAFGTAHTTAAAERDVVTLSIVGTTDLHGNIFARDGRGGLALLGGYLDNLRAARAADGGAVLLIDAGDTYQGGIESNLSEGAVVVDAFEALGYTAGVIGNHEFDFGPVDAPGARQRLDEDPRGAIKARAAQARYPMLAANLVDEKTGKRVDWPNVHASVLVEAAGVKVGIVGIMTIDALRATLRVNVQGLRTIPLAEAVIAEAEKLRGAGAELVIVGAHAGGSCTEFDDPRDLSSCDTNAEIFQLARAMPRGLVDVIVAGHTHQALAHEVAGIAIVQGYSQGRFFSRVDVTFDTRERRVVERTPMAPREICSVQDPVTLSCTSEPASAALPQARYEGRPVVASVTVEAAMTPALARVRALQAKPLGVVLDTPLLRMGDTESVLGNLFADAQREHSGADIAINNNVRGGLRADLPAGELTFGELYDTFPFDNRLVEITLTGAELRNIFADEVRRDRRGALSVSGIRVRAACSPQGVAAQLFHPDGKPIADDERFDVVVTEQLLQGFVFAPVAVPDGPRIPGTDAPVMREAVEDWLRERGGRLDAADFTHPDEPRWQYVGDVPACGP